VRRWGLPEVFLLVQYVLAAFGKVPAWHCVPTMIVVVFLYLYEEGLRAREKSAEDAQRLARRTPPAIALHNRSRSSDAH